MQCFPQHLLHRVAHFPNESSNVDHAQTTLTHQFLGETNYIGSDCKSIGLHCIYHKGLPIQGYTLLDYVLYYAIFPANYYAQSKSPLCSTHLNEKHTHKLLYYTITPISKSRSVSALPTTILSSYYQFTIVKLK